MILQNWWYTTLLGTNQPMQPPLAEDIKTNIVVVGAGMAGLSAAYRLMGKGYKVVLIERNICGGSSTGKSAGFLTPDSELELSQLIRRFGLSGGRDLWEVATMGVNLITSNVQKYGISCDLIKQDSLFLANNADGFKDAQAESEARQKLGYPQTLYSAEEVTKVIGTDRYVGGIRYPGTFGIDALRYSQGLKKVLLENGVQIYEATEAHTISDHRVHTHLGSITADHIIFCADKLKTSLTPYSRNTFHAQTFLSISEPLIDQHIVRLFPSGPVQCWDSDLVYTYYRLTGDGRLLVGGGSPMTTFTRHYVNSPRVISRVIRKFKNNFPFLNDLEFIQYWPGQIDCTRDLIPTILKDEKASWIHWVLGCVGLPWAAFCGDFTARKVLDETNPEEEKYYKYFTLKRNFLIPIWMENFLGKQIVFSLNNTWAKYYQVDQK
jgi:gamma-glutamylputrescine oxidase